MPLCKAFLCAISVAVASGDKSFFVPPAAGKSGPDMAVMLIQGASCAPEAYKPFIAALQAASSAKLWVGVPEFIADTPEPVQFGSKVNEIFGNMQKAGMSSTFTTYVAHSLGGVMSQVHLSGGGVPNVDALVLYGATVLRSNRDSFPYPVLTVDGDLDGLLRVTRQAEAYYNQVTLPYGTDAVAAAGGAFPVVVHPGLTHWSIASGTPPSNVQNNDLAPEVTEEAGHATLAKTVATYIALRSAAKGSSEAAAAQNALGVEIAATGKLVKPLIDAMQLEGHHYLNTPCESDWPTNPTCKYPIWPGKALGPMPGPPSTLPPKNCTCGSEWVMNNAQRMMAGDTFAKNASVASKDSFHDVSDTRPFHLPHIFSPAPGTTCKPGVPCVLNSTTVTMPIYDVKDDLDTGEFPICATEFRTKLKSRQACLEAAGFTNVNFTEVDKANTATCGSINQASIDWALANASPAAKKRYLSSKGQPLKIVEDIYAGIGVTGPKWIKMALSYTPTADNKAVEVQAPYFATENKNLGDESYTHTVGYHYCKLLSPARAMEWIYIDGLKVFGGLRSNAAPAPAPKCCNTCDTSAGLEKYFSVASPLFSKKKNCGECCINPKDYNTYHLFEKNLTKATTNTPCADFGITEYLETETHGFGPLKVTLDMYTFPTQTE